MLVDPTHDADRALVARLAALASLNRLLILRSIRSPRALREIVVRDEGEGAPIARQTVRRHLDALIEADLARLREAERAYGETTEFVVNHQRLFALSEEIRALARMRPTLELDGETIVGAAGAAPATARPCLTLVSGLDVGASFSLASKRAGEEWVIGRKRGVAVPLDFDASVSSENSVLRWDGDAHVIEDLPGSRNGTRVNGQALAPGERRRLAHGDLVGVGRCLLLYWA